MPGDLLERQVGQQFVIAEHQVVADGHDLAEHLGRGLVDADIIAQAFAHFLDAVQPFQQGHGQDHLGFLPVMALQLAADQQVELLVAAAQLHVGLQGHRIVPLHQRIKQFVDGNRFPVLVALGKIVALEDAGHRIGGGQLDDLHRRHDAEPARVEIDHRFFRVKELENLFLVGLGIGGDLFPAQRRPGLVPAAGIADQAGEISDQKDNGVPQVLEVLHLADQDGMSQVDVGGGGIKAGLDQQGFSRFGGAGDLFLEILFADDLQRPFSEQIELFADRGESHPI